MNERIRKQVLLWCFNCRTYSTFLVRKGSTQVQWSCWRCGHNNEDWVGEG